MYKVILDKIRNNRSLAYKLLENRNKSWKEEDLKEYQFLFEQEEFIDFQKILPKVREAIKKEILDSIIKNLKTKKSIY